MRLLVPFVAVCLSLTLGACEPEETEGIADPLAPGAAGTMEVGGGIDPWVYPVLELRGFPAATDVGDDDLFREIPTAAGAVEVESYLVDNLGFPLRFYLGANGIGATGLPYYRVVAWLASAPDTTAPAAGAPWGTAVVALQDCSFACEGQCYCGLAAASADILLETSP